MIGRHMCPVSAYPGSRTTALPCPPTRYRSRTPLTLAKRSVKPAGWAALLRELATLLPPYSAHLTGLEEHSSWCTRARSGSFARDFVERLDGGTIVGRRRRDGDEEVRPTASRHVTQNPPGGLAGHPSGRVHTLDSQANIGDPPGQVIVEVSLHG